MAGDAREQFRFTDTERDLVQSALPEDGEIIDARYFDNYNRPCPVKVTAVRSGGEVVVVVLRLARHGDVHREAQLLPVLLALGLPVPKVLAGPLTDPSVPHRPMTVLSFLPGGSVQDLALNSPEGCETAKRLVLNGAGMLAHQTEAVRSSRVGDSLPRQSLFSFLTDIQSTDHTWLEDPLVVEAVDWLELTIGHIDTPLVFTNGDYNAQNFLTDGQRITGIVDFEEAAFQDPLLGLAKYPVYDLHPLNKAGFVDQFLEEEGYSHEDLRPRLALWCIRTLVREIPYEDGDDHDDRYRRQVLALLRSSLPD